MEEGQRVLAAKPLKSAGHHRRPASSPPAGCPISLIRARPHVHCERLLAVQLGGSRAASRRREAGPRPTACRRSRGQLAPAEVVVDAADAGARMLDDVGHRRRRESARMNIRRRVEDSLLRGVGSRPTPRGRRHGNKLAQFAQLLEHSSRRITGVLLFGVCTHGRRKVPGFPARTLDLTDMRRRRGQGPRAAPHRGATWQTILLPPTGN